MGRCRLPQWARARAGRSAARRPEGPERPASELARALLQGPPTLPTCAPPPTPTSRSVPGSSPMSVPHGETQTSLLGGGHRVPPGLLRQESCPDPCRVSLGGRGWRKDPRAQASTRRWAEGLTGVRASFSPSCPGRQWLPHFYRPPRHLVKSQRGDPLPWLRTLLLVAWLPGPSYSTHCVLGWGSWPPTDCFLRSQVLLLGTGPEFPLVTAPSPTAVCPMVGASTLVLRQTPAEHRLPEAWGPLHRPLWAPAPPHPMSKPVPG